MTDYTHAGGIVYRQENGVFLYLVISARQNTEHWVFPKGHIEPGEIPELTALREVREETGVRGKIIQPIGDSQFQTDEETVCPLWYLMEYLGDIGRKEKREQRWCTFEDGLNLLTFQDGRRLLTLAHLTLQKKVNAGNKISAKELLLADLEYFKNSFWKNEETGEKRVTFFITLVTAVLTFLGAFGNSIEPFSQSFLIIIFALLVLLTLGIVTLFRIIKRNKVTEEYKDSMDHIRNIFKKNFDPGKCLIDYHPIVKDKQKDAGKDYDVEDLRKFGGLAHTVAALNSLILTALVGLILWSSTVLFIEGQPVIEKGPIIKGSILAFVLFYGLQHVFIWHKEKRAKEKLRELRGREVMLKIAITGGAGSGKSTVARMFQELGAQVLDADVVAREAVAVGTPAWQELRLLYGDAYFNPDGSLNRSKLAPRVFENPEERRRLDGIIHPRVAEAMRARLGELARRGLPLVLVEVPLLYETGREGGFDRVIVVSAPEADRVRRLRERDRRGEAEIRGILQAQWPLPDKAVRADYVVDNGGDLDHTRHQVKNIWEKLKNQLDTGN
jgi:dephospho-CoA kinase